MLASDLTALRRCALAVSVLEDVDLVPHADGVLVGGPCGPLVSWTALAVAAGPHHLGSTVARIRVANWLRLRGLVERLGPQAERTLRAAARLVALPPGHAAHPGGAWVREKLRGGALDLGVGVLGVLDDPDAVTLLPPEVLDAARQDAPGDGPDRQEDWWPSVRAHGERMGALAVARLRRDGPEGQVVRPVGGCDVLTLLASLALRTHLAGRDGSGLCALAVPMRTRGWFDLRRVDPAFVAAAWNATEEFDRGLARPLLVTADEVGLARPGGDPTHHGLGRGR